MVCPNISTEEWKDLEKEHGEFKALSLFHLANGDFEAIKDPTKLEKFSKEYESKPGLGPVLKKVSKQRNRLIDSIASERDSLKASYAKGKKKNNEKNRDDIQRLEGFILEFQKAEFGSALESFVTDANRRITYIEKSIKEINPSDPGATSEILKLKNFLGVYSILNDVISVLNDVSASDVVDSSVAEGQIKKMDDAVSKANLLSKKLDHKAKIALSKKIARITGKERGKRKEELERAFGPKMEGESSEAYHSRLTASVQSKLREESKEIAIVQEEKILELFDLDPHDIGTLESWMNDQRSVNDVMIQSIVTMMDKDDLDTDNDFLKEQHTLTSVYKEWLKGKDKGLLTNPLELYKGILELDKDTGKPTGHYTKEYYSEVNTAYKKYVREFNKAVKVDEDLKKFTGITEMGKDIKKRIELTNEFLEKYGKEGSKVELGKFKGDSPIGLDINNIDAKWKNADYDNIKNDVMYKALSKFNSKADGLVGPGLSLGSRVPYIKRGTKESIAIDGLGKKSADAKSFLKNAKDRVLDTFRTAEDDTEFGDTSSLDSDGRIRIATDAFGKPKKKVPLLFRSNGDVSLQSFDLVGNALSNMYNSINYEKKSKRVADVELIKDLVGKRNYMKRQSTQAIMHKLKDVSGFSEVEIAEVEQMDKGDKSNVFKTMESIINDRLYGEGSIQQIVGKVNMNKVASNLASAASYSMLSLNWLGSGINNALQGEVSNFIMAGNRTFFTDKDLLKAHAKYGKDFKNVASNLGSFHSTAKTDQLRHKFLPESVDFNGLDNNFLKNTTAKRLYGDIGGGQMFSKMGESLVQSTIVYASLTNMKMVNRDGQYITLDGDIVTDRSKAATLDEVYKFNKDKGVWELPPSMPGAPGYYVEGMRKSTSNVIGRSDIEFYARRKIQQATERSQGNYSDRNKAMFQRTVGGKLGGLMRRWLIPSVQRRWRGLATHEDDRFFNESIDQFDEGTYVVTGRLLKQMFTHGGSLTERLNGFDKLSVHEKGLVVEAVKDFAVIVAAAVAAAVFRNLAEGADEEDEKKYYTMLYLSKRLQMDLMVFSVGSIGEFSRTLKDPTVALSTVNSTLNLLKFWNWGDEYKTGERAGKNKAWHKLNKTYNPIYKHIIMDFDPKAKVKYLDNVQS